MHAINAPLPDPPITLTPLPPIDAEPTASKERRRLPWLVGAVAGLAIGLVVSPAPTAEPVVIESAPTLDSTLEWMFDAALGYVAVDAAGTPIDPALIEPRVISAAIANPATGPIVTVIEDAAGAQLVYEVSVERHGMGWEVRAVPVGG